MNASASGTPGRVELSVGSLRISERLSFSSTKYGPSVISGRTTQSGTAATSAVGDAVTGVAATAVAASAFKAVPVGVAAPVPAPAAVVAVGCPTADCIGSQAASSA